MPCELLGGDVGVPLVVIAAEKSQYLEPYRIQAVLEEFTSRLGECCVRLGLVAYARTAVPLLDPQELPERVVEAYEEAPVLDGPPNPAPALREAGEMLYEYSNALTRPRGVVLFWSLKSRPRRVLRVASFYISALEAVQVVVAYTTKRRPWLPRYFASPSRILEVDPATRPGRVADAILEALQPPRIGL